MILLAIILSLFSSGIFVSGEIRITLNSGNFSGVWTVRNDSSSDHKIEVRVPGGIYSDLNLTEDLLYRQNDVAYRWVAYENWTYETTFELSEEILNKTAINLVFHGIDTIGDVYLNGQLVQSVNNMFVRYVIPIKDIAKGKNELQVRLKSPVLAAEKLAEAEGYDIIIQCPEYRTHGECNRNFMRKMQVSFGWNVTPAFPSVGIWKPVEIEAFNTALVRDGVGKVKFENETYIIDVTCYYESATEDDSDWGNYQLSIWMSPGAAGQNNGRKIGQTQSLQGGSIKSYHFTFNDTYELEASGVPSWWPNGYGPQRLWTLQCGFETVNAGPDNEASYKEQNFGMRYIELVEEEITPGEEGLSYYFKVNDVPIFVKGVNWIPGHILPELSYDEKMLRHLLQSVKDANMNMIRVWGGGVYESDLFYNICDELGILVWQDMMFSFTLYPSNDKFRQSVATEIDQQIKRLASHPSVAIWSGNDENELMISIVKYWGIYPANLTEKYVDDYYKLYVDTIKPIIEKHDDSRPYSLASPSNGLDSLEEEYIAEFPTSSLYGTKVYTPIRDVRDTISLANGRFFSRFGYESMPSFKTISQVSLPEDWFLESEFSVNREHYSQGYARMTSMMQQFLSLPEDDGSEEFYKTYIYYSQILQAVGNKIATETYRVDRNRLKQDNEGMTGGILLWHLNDVWQAPTWSSIEFGGRWKMAQYYAAKFFAPVIAVPELDAEGVLQVYAVSDLLEDINCTLHVSLYSWDDFHSKMEVDSVENVHNSTSYLALEFKLSDLINTENCSETTCFLHLYLEDDTGNVLSENFYYPSSFANVTNLEPANISVNVTKDESSNDILINLTTDRIAPFVWLETDVEGIFSDNGFTLLTESKDIKFSNRGEEIDIENFKETLSVRSLLG